MYKYTHISWVLHQLISYAIIWVISPPNPMYEKNHIRITLDLEVYEDFEPRQINWDKIFNLHSGETCEAYVEELDAAEVIW